MLTQKELKELVDYDPLTGEFRWRWRHNCRATWNGRYAGKLAGSIAKKSGYHNICVMNKAYAAHTLAWLYMTGERAIQLDHIDGIRTNNKFTNLRKATPSQNQWNRSRQSKSKSGHKGVVLVPSGRWSARICVHWKIVTLGTFDTVKEAIEARKAGEKKYWGEYARKDAT